MKKIIDSIPSNSISVNDITEYDVILATAKEGGNRAIFQFNHKIQTWYYVLIDVNIDHIPYLANTGQSNFIKVYESWRNVWHLHKL